MLFIVVEAGWMNCPHCVQTKNRLNEENLKFAHIVLSEPSKKALLIQVVSNLFPMSFITNITFPQVFLYNGNESIDSIESLVSLSQKSGIEYIGGNKELQAYLNRK